MKSRPELGVDDAKPPLSDQEKQARLVDLFTARSGIYHHSVKADFERDRPARHAHRPDTYFYYNHWTPVRILPRAPVGLWVDPARKLVVVHRVDTGEGLRRGLWFDDGRRVNNRQFLELTGKIMLASP